MPDELWQKFENEQADSENEHKNRCRRYDRWYEVYRSVGSRPASKPRWEADLRVKLGMQVIDTAMVNMIAGAPWINCKPKHPAQAPAAEAMEEALNWFVYKDHLAEQQPVIVQQALIYGPTACKTFWLYREGPKQARQYIEVGQELTPVEYEQRVVLHDRPTLVPWDVYDVWWEQAARDADQAAWIALRSWLTKDEILARRRSDENPHGLFTRGVDELLKSGGRGIPETTAQDRFVGGKYDRRKNRFEIIEVYRDDRHTIFGNREVCLHDGPNQYWHNQKPVCIANVRPDLFKMEGISEAELIDDLQQAIQSYDSMRMDNAHMTVQRGFTYRETGIVDPNQLVLRPRYMWPVTDHDDILFRDQPPLPPEAYRESDVLLGRLQYVTGISPYISGADLNTVDQNTATGVTALQEVASRLLRFKAQRIAQKILQRAFEQWGGLVQQFMTEPILVRKEAPDGSYTWQELHPAQVIGDFDYVVSGTEEALSKQQKRNEILGLLNALAPLAQAVPINWRAISRRVAEAFDFDSPEALFLPQPEAPQAAPAPPAGGNGAAAQGAMSGIGAQGAQAPPLPPQLLQAMQGGQGGG